MTEISRKLPTDPTPGESINLGTQDVFPEGYVEAINGSVGQGSLGAFDRFLAGNISQERRGAVVHKYDHSKGGLK